MKYRSNVPKYSEFVFEIVDPTFHDRASEIRDAGKHNVIVAGASYGQGSSREHAALCPMYLGVKAVIAKSLERIHRANLINFGIVPLTFVNEGDYERIEQSDEVEILGVRGAIRSGETLMVSDRTKGTEFEVRFDLSEREREIVLAGGTLEYVKQKSE
jgi:aconitate hydratase